MFVILIIFKVSCEIIISISLIGGFAFVFEAQDLQTKLDVAIKVLRFLVS